VHNLHAIYKKNKRITELNHIFHSICLKFIDADNSGPILALKLHITQPVSTCRTRPASKICSVLPRFFAPIFAYSQASERVAISAPF